MPIILRVVALGVAFQALIYPCSIPPKGMVGVIVPHEQLVGLALVAAFGWKSHPPPEQTGS